MFSRIARTVRQTVALEAKLAEDRRAREQGEAAEQVRRAATIKQARANRKDLALLKRVLENRGAGA